MNELLLLMICLFILWVGLIVIIAVGVKEIVNAINTKGEEL